MTPPRTIVGLVLCGYALQLYAQQPPAVFHAEARLVVVNVTVQRRDGERITTLDRDAFSVFENGKPQPISVFLREDVPVSAGLVLDNSASVRDRRTRIEGAARTFARAASPHDELFVMNFADMPRLDVRLTRDARAIEAGLTRVDATGGTAVRDAVDAAERYLAEHTSAGPNRKALVVITDGFDNASLIAAEEIKQRAEQAGTAIYAIGLPHDDPSKAKRGRRELDDLTEGTGGLALHAASLDDLDSSAQRLARLIREQYTIAYTPVNQALDGSYRQIRVKVKASAAVSVRARDGYYATASAGANARSRYPRPKVRDSRE